MAIGVDTSKWKPRKITGTPASKFRNLLAAGILGFGILWGAFFQLSSFTEPLKKAGEVLYEDPIEEVERRILIASALPVRSGDQIRKLVEEEQRVDLPHNKYKVVSKYFASKTVMDESLTEFKEKKSFKVTKKAPAKPKVKKVKRVKGQKDIRTVLKGKKNELVAYTEDFDSICKKSGIDVDAEQLQLAIALSKSLQTPETAEGSSSSTKSLTTQQRTGLIRTTLKEYGFKVPEKPTTNRKTKKRKKPYKLLLTSGVEKQQIITDRYSQVLFELNNLKSASSDRHLVISNLFIYNMSTNIDYEHIKDDSVFYVEDLIDETPNNMGCLLKNWSDIPGRPSSPDRDKSELLFSEIECSQDELDIVLSGPLKYSKDILSKKIIKDREKSVKLSPVKRNINKTLIVCNPELIEDVDIHSSPMLTIVSSVDNMSNNEKCKESSTVVITEKEKHLLEIKQPSRSLSPDLFDDEDDTVVEIINETITETAIKPTNNITKEVCEVMDLTECVNTVSQKNSDYSRCIEPVAWLSQQNNVTKRKSNDFMEITECVANTSQHVLERIDEHIDLTGNGENFLTAENNSKCVENVDVVDCVDTPLQLIPKKVDEHIDLTENSVEKENNKSYEDVEITGTTGTFLEDKIVRTNGYLDLSRNCVNDMESKNNSGNIDNIEHMDLTQSSNSSGDSLPFVHIGGTQAVSEKSLNDTILLDENDYLENLPDVIMEINNANDEHQNQPVYSNKNTEIEVMMKTDPVINIDETIEASNVDGENVDLTQTSNSKEAPDHVSNNNSQHINNSSLGKKDDVSVDYDEALENMNSFPYYTHDDNYHNDTGLTEDNLQKTNENDLLSSSRQEVLELSDNENSPIKHKSVENHFDFGGILVIDNLPSFRKSRNTMGSVGNGSMRDSLPMVHVKGSAVEKPKFPLTNLTNEIPSDIRPQTPPTKVTRQLNVETPEQSEYIVKTDNVTPMIDYASMSTPERNRELDKYGLKPFKRKRAIQLLTHLYNQTHPYVESTEELTSPSKKRRTENISQPSSSSRESISRLPRKLTQSPRKSSQTPRKSTRSPRKRPGDFGKLNDSDKENELFLVTREVPVISNVECDADDWVFQKREKAKLHSCRVPLHIAFHNYVSCRRRLHEAILRYEPINIDVIHKQLAASGHRYDPKDLLKFLDKKCITVKTADNTKNNKRY